MTPRQIRYRVIPPDSDAEYAAGMEEGLETDATPLDPEVPVVGMDEQPVPLLKETRGPIAATKAHPKRVDCESERAGTASPFLFCEPLSGWRIVSARERRTKVDRAPEREELLRTRDAGARKVVPVCDDPNTHTEGAFCEAFAPEKARALVRRREFRPTPKHGSWRNVAESESSAMTRQCLSNRRFGTIEELRAETASWHAAIDGKPRGVDWQFRIADARIKLKSLYPKLLV